MVEGQVFWKGVVGGELARFIILSFYQGLLSLHLEITLPFAKFCYAFEENLFFSATIILWKKVIISCLKMNLFVKGFKRLTIDVW